MISLKNINLAFQDKMLFRDFNFSADEGEKVLFCAPSGTGKTSLVHMMMGFIKPDSGSIEIGGKTLSKATVHAIRRQICYIGQDARIPEGTAGAFLSEVGAYAANKGKDFSLGHIESALKMVGLTSEILEKKTDAISGGERRRLFFVLCVLMDRDIWLLDEITAGLDEERKQSVIDYIIQSDKTVIVISHDDAWKQQKSIRSVSW